MNERELFEDYAKMVGLNLEKTDGVFYKDEKTMAASRAWAFKACIEYEKQQGYKLVPVEDADDAVGN